MAKSVIGLDINLDSKQAEQSVGSFKKQLRDATAELVTMSEKFGTTSTQAANAAKKVAGLKDAIGDAKALADTFNPDKKFVALGGALQGVTAGFSAYSGAMGILGADSQATEKILLKVQSAMALQQGISGIMGAMDSFKMLAGTIKGSVVKSFTTLKGAIIGTGIGILVIALGLLIANFDSVKKAVMKLIPGLAEVGDFVGKLVDGFTDFIGVTSEAERAQEKFLKATEDSIKKQEQFLDANADKFDQFTQRKMRANFDYTTKVAELNKDETISEGVKQRRLKEYLDKRNREIIKAGDDRQAAIDAAAKVESDKASAAAKERRRRLAEEEKAASDRLAEGATTKIENNIVANEGAQLDAREKRLADFIAKKAVIVGNGHNAAITAELTHAQTVIANEEILFNQRQQFANATGNVLTTLSDIVGKETAAGKAMAVAAALINTYSAIAGQLRAFAGVPVPGYAIVQAVATGLAGFAAVRNILKTNVPGKSSAGGASVPSISSITAPLTPQAQTTTLDQNSINAVGNAANRAYVLESDVSGNQERVRRLNRASRIN